MEGQPHVKVTLDVIYNELMNVKADVSELKAKSTAAAVADHETRLRTVERKVWTVGGMATAAGAVIAQFVGRLFGTE